MEKEKQSIIDRLNDESWRNNAETVLAALAAIAVVILSKGFIGGFSWSLFFTLEPYASGIAVGIATSIMQTNMIVRGVSDEIIENEKLQAIKTECDDLDKQLTDYEYAEWFVKQYNDKEFERLQLRATEKELRRLKYLISVNRSLGKKTKKHEEKLKQVEENGANVKNYTPIGVQDLLSFNSDMELSGKQKVNYDPEKEQKKKMLKTRIVMFILSGVVAGIPFAVGKNWKESLIFLGIFIPMLLYNAVRTYISTRKVTATTYYKSMQYKKNVLQDCINGYDDWEKEEQVESIDITEQEAQEITDRMVIDFSGILDKAPKEKALE